MSTEEALAQAEELLKPFTLISARPSTDRLDVTILPTAIESAVRAIRDMQWGHLTAITGLDRPGSQAPSPEDKQWSRILTEPQVIGSAPVPEGSIEILYHFCQKAAIVTLRTSVRYSFAVIPSICGIIPAATLYERELGEMYGIKVVGTPSTSKLLLPDDWPEEIFPMRKSFTGVEMLPPIKED
jgi:NADH:ubiquinone oxidoreductase subunit C